MPVGLYDINSASIGQAYDFIVSTVVLISLVSRPHSCNGWQYAGENHSQATILSSVMDTGGIILLFSELPIHPSKEGELASLQGLGIAKYNEEIQAICTVVRKMEVIVFNYAFATMLVKK